MDFGVASIAGSAALTRTGEVVGTLAYMAPEQAEGEAAGPEADVYSLGLVLYEGFSGHNPVSRATPAATARAIGAPIPRLAERRPDLPAALTATIDACLEPYPEMRPHASELGAELTGATGDLDGSRSVPAPGEDGRRRRLGMRRPLIRLAAFAALVSVVAWLASAGGQPGLATVIAVLCGPMPLLFDRIRDWIAPAAAPFLGLVGLAPVYPALAGLAGSPAPLRCARVRRLVLAGRRRGPHGRDPLARDHRRSSPRLGAVRVARGRRTCSCPCSPRRRLPGRRRGRSAPPCSPPCSPRRSIVIRAVGALAWGAALVALHRLLVGGGPDPATAGLLAALAAILVAAVCVRSLSRAPTRISTPANGYPRVLGEVFAGARARLPAPREITAGHRR